MNNFLELLRFYVKVAKRVGWSYVLSHPFKLRETLKTLKYISEKFGVIELYHAWLSHTEMRSSYSLIVSLVTDFNNRKGQNYQLHLRRIFGG